MSCFVTPCIQQTESNEALRLDKQSQTKHTTLQVRTLVLAWGGVQRVQVCLNGRSCAAGTHVLVRVMM